MVGTSGCCRSLRRLVSAGSCIGSIAYCRCHFPAIIHRPRPRTPNSVQQHSSGSTSHHPFRLSPRASIIRSVHRLAPPSSPPLFSSYSHSLSPSLSSLSAFARSIVVRSLRRAVIALMSVFRALPCVRASVCPRVPDQDWCFSAINGRVWRYLAGVFVVVDDPAVRAQAQPAIPRDPEGSQKFCQTEEKATAAARRGREHECFVVAYTDEEATAGEVRYGWCLDAQTRATAAERPG